jgi:hypothetical protein
MRLEAGETPLTAPPCSAACEAPPSQGASPTARGRQLRGANGAAPRTGGAHGAEQSRLHLLGERPRLLDARGAGAQAWYAGTHGLPDTPRTSTGCGKTMLLP